MSAGLSRRAYARHRAARGLPGATDRAVRRALHTGRIQLEPGGLIDAAKADRAWRATTPPRGFQNGRPMTETLARLDRGEAHKPKPAEPEPDDDARGYWSLTRRLRRLLGGWLTHVRAITDALEAEVERTNDDGFSPPTGIPQLDAYVDFMNHISLAHNALEQAVDPALVQYRPRCDCPPECPVHPRPLINPEAE